MPTLNFKHLRYFWIGAKSGSIARVSEQLHLTPQSISGQLSEFEADRLHPRNPQFWLLIALNGLSSAISFILRAYDLPVVITLVLAAFAVGNVALGIGIALRLMVAEPKASARCDTK